jgi:hypothetical protein
MSTTPKSFIIFVIGVENPKVFCVLSNCEELCRVDVQCWGGSKFMSCCPVLISIGFRDIIAKRAG